LGQSKLILKIPFHILRGFRLMSPARYESLITQLTNSAHTKGMEDGIEAFLKRTNRKQRR